MSTSSPLAALQDDRFTTDAFLADSWTRLGWSAFFALFILWGLTWFLRHAFGQFDEPGTFTAGNTTAGATGPYGKRTNAAVDPEVPMTTAGAAGPSVGNDNIGTTGATTAAPGQTAYTEKPERLGGGGLFSVFTRMHRTSEMLRDLLLMLLSVLVLNTVGKASTRAVAILAWIYFAFAVVFAIFESALAHRFVRLAYSLVFYGLAIAIGAIAFRYGFFY